MTTKHTPGPWEVSEPVIERHIRITDHFAIRPYAGPTFAYLPTGRRDIQEANARLIAAAPELLEALRTLYRDVEFLIEDGTLPASARDHAAMSEARAAIQKAEGR